MQRVSAIGLALALAGAMPACSNTEVAIIDSYEDPLPSTCEEFCGQLNFACGNTCEFEDFPSFNVGAGQGVYFRSDVLSSESLEQCATEIPRNQRGAELGGVECCCLVPERTRIDDNNLLAPNTCTDVCAATGRRCEEETYWRDPLSERGFLSGAGGSLWMTGATNFTGVNVSDCDTILPLLESIGERYTLHQCGCD